MTYEDRPAFRRAFQRIVETFRLKLRPVAAETLEDMYFEILEHAPLDQVLEAGKECAATCRTFPKPMTWLAALPNGAARKPEPDQRTMGVTECHGYHDAERLHWQDEPCPCLTCQAADITHLPLRFVPEFHDEGPEIRVFDAVRGRVVVAGHWAHGDELAAWYRAREVFFASAPIARQLLARVVPALNYMREPGEEG